MKPCYDDLVSRFCEPEWYDARGVPRYAPFATGMCDVYARAIALLRISCQACGQEFLVASERGRREDVKPPDFSRPDPWDVIGSFHYGDPPYHGGCVGETQNSVPLEVVEYWQKSPDWRRMAEYEKKLLPFRGEW